MSINAPVIALALLAAASSNQPVQPTKKDVQEAISAQSYYPCAEGDILSWRQDLRAFLKRDNPDAAADALAVKYGIARDEMRRLVRAWIIAQSRQYEPDRSWVGAVRTEFHALAPLLHGKGLGLAIIAEALDATSDDCSAADFNWLIKGSADPAADAYVIATTWSCDGNFARAAVAGGDRAVPALIRAADYGGLPPRDALPLYAWLTSPVALAHVRESDRFAVSVILWQRYLTALFDADLHVRALAAFDALPPDLRGAVISPDSRQKQVAVVDGIAMTFAAEDKSDSMSMVAQVLDDQADVIGFEALPRWENPHPRITLSH